ncbi:MAG: polysaccharide deacetylase [Proteobacteria bacterium]|nr:polysaccharide deacetylase [Pseudomonadota bacterium]
MPRHIACLTFDFDALSTWIARGMMSPTSISRGEFGVIGARRILKLLSKYDIKSTWFVPGHTIETYPEASKAIADAGHEIANHGWTHRSPLGMSAEEEETELLRANDSIKRLIGKKPVGYRSPIWDLTPNTVKLLVRHQFLYESNLMANDYTPFRTRTDDKIELLEPAVFGPETPLIEIPVSWSLDDAPHFELVRTPNWVQPGLMQAEAVLSNWLNDFRYLTDTEEWGALTYTCHPYCIGRGHRIRMLEQLIRGLLEMGATFLPMHVLADEFDKRAPFKRA